MGIKTSLIEKKGAFIRLVSDGSLLGQGAKAARQTLKDSPGLANDLERAIRDQLFNRFLSIQDDPEGQPEYETPLSSPVGGFSSAYDDDDE